MTGLYKNYKNTKQSTKTNTRVLFNKPAGRKEFYRHHQTENRDWEEIHAQCLFVSGSTHWQPQARRRWGSGWTCSSQGPRATRSSRTWTELNLEQLLRGFQCHWPSSWGPRAENNSKDSYCSIVAFNPTRFECQVWAPGFWQGKKTEDDLKI